MVIGWLKRDDGHDGPEQDGSLPWQRVEHTQNHPHLPCLLVPQPAHAVMAGDLAEALLPTSFGDIPREIQQAIMMHDTGWAMLDAAQLQRLRSDSAEASRVIPVPFTGNSAQEMVEAWTASINSVERLTKAGAVVASRHFVLLAKRAPAEHRRFADAERSRQRLLENEGVASAADLTRWTAALGFCDLVSLYLLTGLRSETSFPLAHPASPQAQTARRVTLTFDNTRLRFSPAVFQSGSGIEIEALKHPLPAQGARTEKLSWEII